MQGPCSVCHVEGCSYINHTRDYDGFPAKQPPQIDPAAHSRTLTLASPIEGTFQRAFREFLQMLVNRRALGQLRYGTPNKKQKYLSRLRKELEAYSSTGNQEHLLNIAVYCGLEIQCPEHPNSYIDVTADSATRDEFGGNIA